jgi:hypothetical protein
MAGMEDRYYINCKYGAAVSGLRGVTVKWQKKRIFWME